MSKAAQFDVQEKQGFIQAQPQYAQQPQQAYYAQPMYNAQPMYAQPMPGQMQAYPPPTNVVVINHVPATGGWKDPGCCTICWGVFLLICAIGGSISGIYAVSAIQTVTWSLQNCDPSMDWCSPSKVAAGLNALATVSSIASAALSSNIIQLVLIIAVVVFYCKKSTHPAARAWNYACWIFIALAQSAVVFLMLGISIVVSGGSLFLGSVLRTYLPQGQSSFDAALSIIAILFWVNTAVCAIPMIVSSVVAHQNKAPCTCSGRSTDYVD